MNPKPYIQTGYICPECDQPWVTANPRSDHPFIKEDETVPFCPGCSLIAYHKKLFPKDEVTA